jgi:hypothetical protein
MSYARTTLPHWNRPPAARDPRAVDWSRLGLLALASALCIGAWAGVALLLTSLI